MKKSLLLLLSTAFAFASCSDDAGVYEEFDKPDVDKPGGWVTPEPEKDYDKYTLTELGEAAGVMMGVGATKEDLDKSAVSSIIYRQFKSVTFGNEMKNDAIMGVNGRLDFTKVDQMVTDLNNNGMKLFGHVLGWHSQQKYEYLNGLVESAATYGAELKTFIDFEGEGSTLGAWGGALAGNEKTDAPKNVFAGDKALALTVAVTDGNAWDAQANINIPSAEAGKTYAVCFWMKAESEGALRISTTDNQYLYDPTPIAAEWKYYTAPVKVQKLQDDGSYSVRLDMGTVSTTYYIDNVRVVETEEQGGTVNYISPDDILGDGTFEDYNSFDDAYNGQGWNNYGNTKITVVTSGAHNGDRAVQVDALEAAGNKWTHQVIWPATATAKKDGPHVVGMWVKAVEFADASATEGYFQLKVTTPASGDKYYDMQKVTREWEFLTFALDNEVHDIKAGDTIAVTIQAGGTDSGTDVRQMRFLIDDMQIYPEGSDPTPGDGDNYLNENTIVTDGDFDSFASKDDMAAAGWTFPNGNDYISLVTDGGHSGKVAVATDNTEGTANDWSIQFKSPVYQTRTAGAHTVGFWAKADVEDRYIQIVVSVNGKDQYKSTTYNLAPITDAWTYITYTTETGSYGWDEIAAGDEISVAFQCGGTGADSNGHEKQSKLLIDDFQIYPTPTANASAFYARMTAQHKVQAATRAAAMESTTKTVSESADDRIDAAFKSWVFGMVEKFGDQVYAWDAVNELFDDTTKQPRTNNRELVTDGHFYWGDFLGGGEAWAVKAFKYAKAAKADAVLYLNDYNLEYDEGKLDAFCAFVEKYRAEGLIDGVATQMHTHINQDRTAIDNMFVKLAATGLLVRISELDIDANPGHTLTSLTDDVAQKQAELYAYIVESYFTHVPAAQRGGITIWGTRDDGSWLNDEKGDAYPLLFDADGNKKPAYKSVYDVLLKYSGLETAATTADAE